MQVDGASGAGPLPRKDVDDEVPAMKLSTAQPARESRTKTTHLESVQPKPVQSESRTAEPAQSEPQPEPSAAQPASRLQLPTADTSDAWMDDEVCTMQDSEEEEQETNVVTSKSDRKFNFVKETINYFESMATNEDKSKDEVVQAKPVFAGLPTDDASDAWMDDAICPMEDSDDEEEDLAALKCPKELPQPLQVDNKEELKEDLADVADTRAEIDSEEYEAMTLNNTLIVNRRDSSDSKSFESVSVDETENTYQTLEEMDDSPILKDDALESMEDDTNGWEIVQNPKKNRKSKNKAVDKSESEDNKLWVEEMNKQNRKISENSLEGQFWDAEESLAVHEQSGEEFVKLEDETKEKNEKDEFSDTSYWRNPLPDIKPTEIVEAVETKSEVEEVETIKTDVEEKKKAPLPAINYAAMFGFSKATKARKTKAAEVAPIKQNKSAEAKPEAATSKKKTTAVENVETAVETGETAAETVGIAEEDIAAVAKPENEVTLYF